MITTGCEGCCFLRRDNKGVGCVLGQMCVVQDDRVIAPGYCRLCRTHRWAKQQETTEVKELHQKVIEECALKFELLVVFDEAVHTLKDLKTTLEADWYIKYATKVIIVDVTGFGDRKNLALQYIKSRRPYLVETIVDSSAIHEPIDQREATIRRISAQVTAPFFMVVPAGKMIGNIKALAINVQQVPSRVIHWSFSFGMGATAVVPYRLQSGLFITKPYRALIKNNEGKTFDEQVRSEEAAMDMGLTWFCQDCWLA